ncbi:18472_t:CDS:2 [Funneliformis geosporum]|uniref:1291_t:CDS:1 n=1 Tax=Funneliformis geosporum TaxID=1117311 RepID=A0A9W4SR15_9GLOM|nr:18472_t:CDS:2 [Funneliformis geosporum]CAI2179610.1 1291_t:CDS:2 [Funneliformis geosporum]
MDSLKFIRHIPLIISTIFKYFTRGPPQPSWNLKLYLSLELTRSLFKSYSGTIEELQNYVLIRNESIPSHIKIDKIFISHEYRINAQAYIERLVKPYEVAIDPIWKSPRNNGINGEFIMNKDWNFNNEEGSWEKEKIVIFLHGGGYCCGNIDSSREILCEISKLSGARILAIEYRLAPQQPFPAALCDALAAYLYLKNPPNDARFKPYKPEQIVLLGSSAGGGLSLSLGLALRDLGLSLPAGIALWSPWVDQTHSMPSYSDQMLNEIDYVPLKTGNLFANGPSIAFDEFKQRAETITRKIQQSEIKLIGDESLKRIGQPINFYVVNEGLAIPYVSPVLAESLGGLPPMLIVTGNVERYRDEAIYLSYRASNPEKYRLPAYETNFDNSRFKFPTEVTLEVFDEMFHVFQAFKYCEPANVSIRRTSNFISRITQESVLANPLPHRFSTLKISYDGEVRPLSESSINHILRWDQVGVYPDV